MSTIPPLPTVHLENDFTSLTNAVIFFHKALCPHCKNMEKVLAKFSAKISAVELFSIDSEAHSEIMEKLAFERVPTLVFIRNGSVATVHSGLMNPKELKALYEKLP